MNYSFRLLSDFVLLLFKDASLDNNSEKELDRSFFLFIFFKLKRSRKKDYLGVK